MAKFTNHKNDFHRINLLNKINSYLFWGLLVINIVPELLKDNLIASSQCTNLEKGIDFLNIFLFIASFLITIITEFVLIPIAEKKRRTDYFENSFAKNFQLKSSMQYFTNEEIMPGFYKMAINLFQNLLFTTKVSKSMSFGIIVKGIVAVVVFFILSCFGLSANKIFIPILQAVFSLNILGHTIKFLIYYQRMHSLFAELKTLFFQEDFKQRIDAHIPQILKMYVDYECNISWGLISLEDSHFQKMNNEVEMEWQEIKTKFKIQ